ncbi:hypothetical protein VTL71DRAFT_1516 [Oculimacula yallundae]|uniref:Uncharacterized protein n=1 Tax=Oculimacula yallundae TaxID=86028 RepID=A0ABR4CBQ8_9HELO
MVSSPRFGVTLSRLGNVSRLTTTASIISRLQILPNVQKVPGGLGTLRSIFGYDKLLYWISSKLLIDNYFETTNLAGLVPTKRCLYFPSHRIYMTYIKRVLHSQHVFVNFCI